MAQTEKKTERSWRVHIFGKDVTSDGRKIIGRINQEKG